MIDTSRPSGPREDFLEVRPSTEPKDEDFISVSPTQRTVTVDRETARQRAVKAHLALGEHSPGVESLTHGILSGQEDLYRQQALKQAEIDFQRRKLRYLDALTKQSEGPLSDHEREFVLNMGQAEFDVVMGDTPETIWETEYGQAFTNKIATLNQQLLDEAMALDPNKLLDFIDADKWVIARQEIARKIVEDLDAQVKQSSWANWGSELIGNIIPWLPWYRVQNALKEAPSTSFLPGNNLEEQFEYLWSLPPSEFQRQLKAAVDDIASRNKQTALFFASAALSFSSSDKFLNNLIGVADVFDAATLGVLAVTRGPAAIGRAVRSVPRGLEKIIDTTKAVSGAAFDPMKATPLERFKKMMLDAHRAMNKNNADVGDALAGAGDVKGAARHDILAETVRAGEALRDFNRMDPLNKGRSYRSRLWSIFDQDSIFQGATAFSREFTERLKARLLFNAANALTTITRPGRADRLPLEAFQVAVEIAEQELRTMFRHASDRVIDVVQVVRAEDTADAVNSVAIRLGKATGELFVSRKQAWQNARSLQDARLLSLDEGSYAIKQQGNGYYIEVYKDVDETHPLVRAALITTDNKTPQDMWNTFLGFLRTSRDTLSLHQSGNRLAVVSGATEVQRLLQEVAKDFSRLSSKERDALDTIFKKNRDYKHHDTGERGMFHETLADLEQAYLKEHNRLPTEKEASAYFAYVQVLDTQYMYLDLALTRDKARQGIQNMSYKYSVPDPDRPGEFFGRRLDFEGKKWDNDEFQRVLFSTEEDPLILVEGINGDNSGLRLFTKNDRAELDQLVKEQNYSIVEVANPTELPLLHRLESEEVVKFVLVQNPQASPLKWGSLPYKPGGHVEQAADFYIKQPKVSRLGEDPLSRTHHYRGDTTILALGTGAQAKKYAPLLDQARILYRENRIDELRKFLDDNLPFDLDDFRQMFEPRIGPDGREQKALLHLDDPIVVVPAGRNTLDEMPDLGSRYSNFRNEVRSSFNLYQNINKKFTGQRNQPVQTIVEELGSEITPLLSLADAPVIDPFTSLERTTANMIHNRFMNDYKIGAVESWISEFGDLLTEYKLQGGRDRIAANPEHYLHTGILDSTNKDLPRLKAAENSRNALLSLLGTEGPLQAHVNYLTTKLMDTIYNTKGQKAVQFTKEHLLSREVDPARAIRGFAFHTKLGLFNWQQFFVNSQTLTHILGVAGPVNALPSMAAASMMLFARINAKPQVLDKLGGVAQAMGYNKKLFIESWEEMKHTGLWNIKGSTVLRDDMRYDFIESNFGKVLNWGTTFFDESERLMKLAGWNTAFLEFRKANPTAVIDNVTRNRIFVRAEDLAGNMTAASKAAWQNGVWSVPAQFLTYQMRITEQMLGKRLTNTEKVRAFATYGMMYGIPSALAATTGIPFYEQTRKAALDRGIDLSNPMMHAFQEGLLSLVLKYATGTDWAVSQRYALGGLPIFDMMDADDKLGAFVELTLGASGSIGYDAVKSFDPFLHALTTVFSEDNERFPLKAGDFLEPLTVVSSVNNFTKMWWAMNAGRFITKNQIYLGDATPFQAIFSGITGLTPSEINDGFLRNASMAQVAAAQRETEKEVIKNLRIAYNLMSNGDEQGFNDYMKRARILIVAGGFQPDQRARIMAESIGGNTSLVNQARHRHLLRSPTYQQQQRLDRFVDDVNKGTLR